MDIKQELFHPVVITLSSLTEIEELLEALKDSPTENRTEKEIRDFLEGII